MVSEVSCRQASWSSLQQVPLEVGEQLRDGDCAESDFLASTLSREHLGRSAVKPLTAGVLSYNRKNFMFDKAGNPSVALPRVD